MSRAINISATQRDVSAVCARRGLTISAIESLECGGTRVVLTDRAGADQIREAFGRKVLTGEVQRTPLRSWPR